MTDIRRDYDAIVTRVTSTGPRERRMGDVADILWDSLSPAGMSWGGFYIDQPDQPDDRRLVLGAHRDSPACSPIGLHGVCGQALLSRAIRIIIDTRELGDAYVACDPRDRSEIVIPLVDEHNVCWGVLDLDSWDVGAFNEADATGLKRVLAAAGFTPPD